MCAKLLQLCPTLCDPMDYSPPGPSLHGILQERILEWVAMPYSRGSSWLRDWTWVSCVSCIGRWVWCVCMTWFAPVWSLDCKFWGGRGRICLCPPVQASTLQGVDCSITICWIDCECLKYFNQQNVLNNLNYSKSTHLHMNKAMLIKKLLSYS